MSALEIEITIPEGGEGRLDKVLAELMPEEFAFSRSRLQELIEAGRVFQEGKAVLHSNAKAKPGQTYRLNLPEPVPSEILAEDIALEIVYEDADLLVVNKPSGMVVHPAVGAPHGTLVNALLHHAQGSLSGIGGVERPGIVHRIDKDTSGLLVVAKSDRAHKGLSNQFRDHSIERLYSAFVYGALDAANPRVLGLGGVKRSSPKALRIDLPIGRHPTDRLRQAIRKDGRHSITHIQIIGYDESQSITEVECRLETGRTHQIRAHLSHIGHPLLGDPLYGKGARQLPKSAPGELREHTTNLHGQALHARVLGFIHPLTGERLRFETPLPADMQSLQNFIPART